MELALFKKFPPHPFVRQVRVRGLSVLTGRGLFQKPLGSTARLCSSSSAAIAGALSEGVGGGSASCWVPGSAHVVKGLDHLSDYCVATVLVVGVTGGKTEPGSSICCCFLYRIRSCLLIGDLIYWHYFLCHGLSSFSLDGAISRLFFNRFICS